MRTIYRNNAKNYKKCEKGLRLAVNAYFNLSADGQALIINSIKEKLEMQGWKFEKVDNKLIMTVEVKR